MSATPIAVFQATLTSADVKAQIKRMLPPDITIDKFTETTLAAVQNNPGILDCEKNSLYTAVLRCAQDGLLPDGRQAAIVSFNSKVPGTNQYVKKAQAMPMVGGIVHMFGKAGIKAYAASVFEYDKIRLWNDDSGQHIEHEPKTFGERGPRIGVYAVARDKHGNVWIEAANMEDIKVFTRATKQKNDKGELIGPWRDTPDRMEQKSVLHRLAKRIPHVAIREDDEFGEGSVVATVLPQIALAVEPADPAPAAPPKPGRPRALQQVVDQSEPAQEPEMAGPSADSEDSQAEIF